MIWFSGIASLRAQADTEPKALFQKVLESTLQNNYSVFMSVCDQTMRDMVTADMLSDRSRTLVASLHGGYTPVYMGYLDKQGAKVYYWKLVLKNRGDDMLVSLVVRDNLVSAFNIK